MCLLARCLPFKFDQDFCVIKMYFFVITSAHRSLIDVLIFVQSRHSFFFWTPDKYSFLAVYSLFML